MEVLFPNNSAIEKITCDEETGRTLVIDARSPEFTTGIENCLMDSEALFNKHIFTNPSQNGHVPVVLRGRAPEGHPVDVLFALRAGQLIGDNEFNAALQQMQRIEVQSAPQDRAPAEPEGAPKAAPRRKIQRSTLVAATIGGALAAAPMIEVTQPVVIGKQPDPAAAKATDGRKPKQPQTIDFPGRWPLVGLSAAVGGLGAVAVKDWGAAIREKRRRKKAGRENGETPPERER